MRLLRIVLIIGIKERQRGATHFSRFHSIILQFLIAMANLDTKQIYLSLIHDHQNYLSQF